MVDGLFNVNISGIPEVIAKVRSEVSGLIREVASHEQDQRVVARLYEVEAMLTQRITHAEAEQRVGNAPVTGGPRMGQVLARNFGALRIDAVATSGGKATVETLAPPAQEKKL